MQKTSVSISVSSGVETALAMLDGDKKTFWRSAPGGQQSVVFAFSDELELGGLVIDWGTDDGTNFDTPTSFAVAVPDGERWRTVYSVNSHPDHKSHIALAGLKTTKVKFVLRESVRGTFGIRGVEFMPVDFSQPVSRFWGHVAATATRGHYPDALATLLAASAPSPLAGLLAETEPAAVSKHPRSGALLDATGTVGVDFSLEPFVSLGRKDTDFYSWAQATSCTGSGDAGVTRTYDRFELAVAARKQGDVTYVRYRVKNTSDARINGKLFAALRPFRTSESPAKGWFAAIRSIKSDAVGAVVNGNKAVVPLTLPAPFGATTLDGGDISAYLSRGRFPMSPVVRHKAGFCSGAFGFLIGLEPGEEMDYYLAVAPEKARGEISGVRAGGEDGTDLKDLPQSLFA